MKYTIELTDNQKKQMDFMLDMANKHMGFNRKLEMIETTNVEDTNEYQIGYKAGRKDGFAYCKNNTELIPELKKVEYNKGLEDARQTLLNLLEIPSGEWGSIFDQDSYYVEAIFKHYSISEIQSRIKAYEEKKKADEESIQVGDEVKDLASNNIGVVLSIGQQMITYMTKIDHVYSNTRGSLEKTGRHFDEVQQLLSKLKE